MMGIEKKHCLLLAALCALFFFGNHAVVITDPVESNYALTAKEMLESGDYISPRIYGRYWYDKPVMFYWELIAAFKLFGINDFAARFFPALFGTAGVFMAYAFARRIYDETTGFFAAAMLATSFEYWLLSKTVITDMTLFVFFNAVLAVFFLAYHSGKRHLYLLCYAFAGLAVMTKGPIGILLPGLVITLFLAAKRDLREFLRAHLLPGALIFAVVGGSWYALMYSLHGRDFIDTFLGIHNVLRATVSEHEQWNVWYYYTAIFFIGFFPWSFVLPMAVRQYWKSRSLPRLDDRKLFLLIWALAINVFYQCMATKYSTYTLPALMPIAILAARFLQERERLVHRLLAASVPLYIALTVFVAIPVCSKYDYSANNEIALMSSGPSPEDVVLSYGLYQASLVYYTGHTVYLLDSPEAIENLRPKDMSWTAKNVMPFMAFSEIPTDRKVYLIVNERRFKEFDDHVYLMPQEWQLLGKTDSWRVYCRPAQKDEGKGEG